MEFILLGCDVFTSEVDDHGIDLVVRTRQGHHYDVQVKSFRSKSETTPYVYVQKSLFPIEATRLLALIQFIDGQSPTMFLIQAGRDGVPHAVLESRDFVGKQSDPEWGLTLSKRKLVQLSENCCFHATATSLFEL